MAKGISIHVGVNQLDTAYYGTSFPVLEGAEIDAREMADLAETAGFGERTLLLGRQATAGAVKTAIRGAIRRLVPGDLLLISFSGHGSRIVNGADLDDRELFLDDEDGQYDETWCTCDRDIVDDELYALWTEAAAGTRIVVVSDSCFSGDIVRDAEIAAVLAYGDDEEEYDEDEPEVMRSYVDPFEEAHRHGLTLRGVSPEVHLEISARNAPAYREAKQEAARQTRPALQASVLLLSACSQNEYAVEKDGHGIFTRALLDAWHREELSGGYPGLHRSVVMATNAVLRTANRRPMPGWSFAAARNDQFLNQPPFFVDDEAWSGRALRIRSRAVQGAAGSIHQD